MQQDSLYRVIWRWHFYAGLFVIPFIIILSVTGSIYLFKPQIDQFQEREWRGLDAEQMVTVDEQFRAMQSSYPDAIFHHYRLAKNDNDAAIFHIGLADDSGMRDIYVAPDAMVLAAVDPESRISNFVAKVHSSLLIGSFGRYLVEIAASWAIIMIISGLYLWWPRQRKMGGILWPRIMTGKRIFWRDIHAVTGFYASGLALILLLSALPWTQGWASGFNMLRAEMGWVNQQKQDWRSVQPSEIQSMEVEPLHIEHDHQEMLRYAKLNKDNVRSGGITLQRLDRIARQEQFSYPIIIRPKEVFKNDQKLFSREWKLSSQTQDRPLRRSVSVDGVSGDIIARSEFTDRHIIDQIISYGIAWHEGQLLGWFNQLIGVFTALALVILCYSGIRMWWHRRPKASDALSNKILGRKAHIADKIGVPPMPKTMPSLKLIGAFLTLCAILLPAFGASLLLILIVDFAVKTMKTA